MGSDSEIFAILGRIHVLLRRDLNRITDIEWARVNKDYARELVRLSGTGSNPDLPMLAAKLSQALELASSTLRPVPAQVPVAPPPGASVAPQPQGPTTQTPLLSGERLALGPRYLGGLR